MLWLKFSYGILGREKVILGSFYFVFVRFLLFRYMTGIRGRGRKLMLEDVKEKRKRGYWKLKEKRH
jgi:hypothetical protein